MKVFSKDEVSKHNKQGDLWVIIDSKVYDLSKFGPMHPGSEPVLLDEEVAGRDATETFFALHRVEVLERPQYARLQIGTVEGEKPSIYSRAAGAISDVPYSEPQWLTSGYHSPYFQDHHREFQRVMRKYVDELIFPDAQDVQHKATKPSEHVFDFYRRTNIHAMRLGPGPHLHGRLLLDGAVKPEEFDAFHDLIMAQEMARLHARGYHDGVGGGTVIGLPAVKNFAKPAVRDKILTEVLDGKKLVALAITEAFAGSDVSGIKTVARKTADGKFWEVTKTKKWITNGVFADYFVTAASTVLNGIKGLTLLLIERDDKVSTRHINAAYGPASGTAFVTFDHVLVPVEHTLGQENNGLIVVLSNFNHERWGMAASSVSMQRLVVEECMKWCAQRKVFGKPLNAQPVVRAKLAAMMARVESAQAWLEIITYQKKYMDYQQQSALLAGPIALLKKHCTETAQETARDAVQLFGGRGITKTGMGRFIEHYHTGVTADAILGGTEDVLGDLGVRQAMKQMPKNTRL
ncbi:acyl-CoA dehydrogenase [Mycena floridula]|nr:acyl-CoA dehydrogenase [Mycena floridula]